MKKTKKDAQRFCLYCGMRIEPGRNGSRKYCKLAHKQAAYRERKHQKETARK